MKTSDTTSRLLSAVLAVRSARITAGAREPTPRPGDSPEVARLRKLLGSADRAAAKAAASELLELIEPASLAEAHASVFEGAAPPEARAALRDAWDAYRHDRYRGLN